MTPLPKEGEVTEGNHGFPSVRHPKRGCGRSPLRFIAARRLGARIAKAAMRSAPAGLLRRKQRRLRLRLVACGFRCFPRGLHVAVVRAIAVYDVTQGVMTAIPVDFSAITLTVTGVMQAVAERIVDRGAVAIRIAGAIAIDLTRRAL